MSWRIFVALLFASSLALACARHVVVEREDAIRGLGDRAWTIEREPVAATADDPEPTTPKAR